MARGGALMASTIGRGGVLHYAVAGSSGLMTMADACELAGTFGVNPSQIRLHMAGGIPQDAAMPGGTEDDVEEAREAARDITAKDVVILISASGSTPYVLEIAALVRKVHAATICIANNKTAPPLDLADVAVCLPTPPEVLAGSTRLGASTAQKMALNTISTLVGVVLGHVHDGMMVNLRANNAKLRARAVGMVAMIAQVDDAKALRCLDHTNGDAKPAILIAAGAADLNEANARLLRANGILRPALAHLTSRN